MHFSWDLQYVPPQQISYTYHIHIIYKDDSLYIDLLPMYIYIFFFFKNIKVNVVRQRKKKT